MSRYATVEDFYTYGLPMGAVGGALQPTQIQSLLDAASAMADGYISNKYTLPLVGDVDLSLKIHVCKYAAYEVMSVIGFKPESSADMIVRQGYDDAIAFFVRISKGMFKLSMRQSQPESYQPEVITSEPRGFDAITDVSGSGNWGL